MIIDQTNHYAAKFKTFSYTELLLADDGRIN